ncbi:hypothetical protein BU16DRAFT_391004 [Lophium mytilinum]|uniref:EthD domain-containing protein n=1 Tax=Lophium mytilinum TaxID=390894 RepID=A0A6A6QTI0_9PEZI|nr:hypothetical protein BU16DRAFT_391004 [Lophium mytilinum]
MSSATSTPIYVTFLYPTNTSFNMTYYLNTHIPLTKKKYAPYGLRSCVVCDTADSPAFAVMVVSTWESIEGWNEAQKAECTKAIVEDVKNYTDGELVVLVGKVVG